MGDNDVHSLERLIGNLSQRIHVGHTDNLTVSHKLNNSRRQVEGTLRFMLSDAVPGLTVAQASTSGHPLIIGADNNTQVGIDARCGKRIIELDRDLL